MRSSEPLTNTSEVFAIIQQVSSNINKDRIHEIVDNAKGLKSEDRQLVVDVLGTALENSQPLLKKADDILLLLVKIASSANVLARNRIINPRYIEADDECLNVFRILGESSIRVEVVRRGENTSAQFFSERLVTWAHLSHENVLPIYGAFLDGDDGLVSLISPQVKNRNIAIHSKTLPQVERMPLISDVINGLCYLHNLGIVHGALNPQNVFISQGGGALIAGLDASSDSIDAEVPSSRYFAPEMLDDDDPHPETASDMWSLGCVIYEILSKKVPFYQILQENKVRIAIAAGKKPIRPSWEGNDVEGISDAIWLPIYTCFEFEAIGRPTLSQFQMVFASLVLNDNRPVPTSMIQVEVAELTKISEVLHLDLARSILMRIFGSDLSMPAPSQIPEHLQKSVFELAENFSKVETVAAATKKLNVTDTQILVNVLDLAVQEKLPITEYYDPVIVLLRKIMISTHIFPQRYKIDCIRYDPAPIAEGNVGKVHKGCDLDVCVSVVSRPGDISNMVEALAHSTYLSHPNILPIYGVFQEDIDEIPRFCLTTPYMKNGLLRDYAPRLSQKDRVPLISDVLNSFSYLHKLGVMNDKIRTDKFLISDEGRALSITFDTADILIAPAYAGTIRTSESYPIRFYAPERESNDYDTPATAIWSFGCLLYEVLVRKPPSYQYADASEIRSALSRGERPARPSSTEGDVDEIGDQFWDLIMGCCTPEPEDRLTVLEVQKLLGALDTLDHRPETTSFPGSEALTMRSRPDVCWDGAKRLIDQIQVELLQNSLSKLVQNTKDVGLAVAQLEPGNIQTLVDFLDLVLKDHMAASEERNRILALLSRVTTLTQMFAKDHPGAAILRLRSNPDIDLNRVGKLLDQLQVQFLAQSILQYSIEDVVTAVTQLKLEENDTTALVEFWDLDKVIKDHLFPSSETNQALALLSTLISSTIAFPQRYFFSTFVEYEQARIGNGSFGTVRKGSNPNLCIKVTDPEGFNPYFCEQWLKAFSPMIYSSHPNILPCYGMGIGRAAVALVSPFLRNGNLLAYGLSLPVELRLLVIFDVIEALIYLHGLGIVHGNLKGENVIISNEDRALVSDFRPYHINVVAAEVAEEDMPIGPYVTTTLRFTAPELVKNRHMLPTTKSDIWSVGCLFYLVLSRKVPFHQYSQDSEIRSALSRGELPLQPISTGDGADEIDDLSWDLITKCCTPAPDDRPTLGDIKKWLVNLGIQDSRPPAKPLPGAEIMKHRSPHPGVDLEQMGDIMARIKSQLPSVTKDKEEEVETRD